MKQMADQKPRMTQAQMYYAQVNNIAEGDSHFCELVKRGEVSKKDLSSLIARRPARYGRFAGFMDGLPDIAN